MLDNAYHVYPINDTEKHYLECVYPLVGIPYCPCKCSPTMRQEGTAFIIVHNSFDGREGIEWTNEILNQ